MDKGREIDNAQNTNAVYIDKYGNGGKTSVKTSNPGGRVISPLGGADRRNLSPSKKEERNDLTRTMIT